MMQVRSRHWFAALGLAALIHATLLAIFYLPSKPSSGARSVGLNGIEIGLGPAGGAVEAHKQKEVVREEVKKSAPIVEAKPEPKIEPIAESQPNPESKMARAEMASADTQVTEPKQQQLAPTGQSASKNQPVSADGDMSAGGGVAGSRVDYLTLLSAWLERHKQYPSRAQRRRQEGTVDLRFVVDREGNVLSYKIERTSGYALLDREVEKMIRRAEPLPAMPNELVQASLELVVPVSFYIR